MSTLKRIRFLSNLLVASVFAGSCTFPVTTTEDFEVHFGRPGSGDVIMVGETFELLANGYSTAGDVSRVLYFANGRIVGEAPNHFHDEIVAEYFWTPTEAGEYTLQIAAQRGSEYGYSSTIKVCVLPFQIAPGHPYDIYAHEYDGDCSIPARSGSAVPGEPTMTTVSSNPQRLNYIPWFFDVCPDETRFVNFKVYIDDPHDDVVFAAIAINITPARGGRTNSETTVALTHVSDTPPHTKNFVGGIDMHIFLARSLENPESGGGYGGDMNWSARAFGRDGGILIEEGPFIIPVSAVNCDGSAFAPTATPSPSPSPSPAATLEQSTSTPASALDCPPGTYYSDITHKCYAYATPTATPKNGGNDGNELDCPQYTSDSACKAAGCTFNYTTKSCQ